MPIPPSQDILDTLLAYGAECSLVRDDASMPADDSRSQEGNRQSAIARLAELVAKAAVQPKPRRKTKPSRGAKLRRLDSKRRRSETKARRRESF